MAELKLAELKLVEQKIGGNPRHWVAGIPSASAKRSAEQKMALAELKLAEQKFGGDPWPLGGRDP